MIDPWFHPTVVFSFSFYPLCEFCCAEGAFYPRAETKERKRKISPESENTYLYYRIIQRYLFGLSVFKLPDLTC